LESRGKAAENVYRLAAARQGVQPQVQAGLLRVVIESASAYSDGTSGEWGIEWQARSFLNFRFKLIREIESWENGIMKDVMELLRSKEQELAKVKRQVEALRVALPLLEGGEDQRLSLEKSPSARDAASST
jgi:hypothetical protein